MKWFIASDIHGSAYWCSKMLEAFQREEADRMLLLGDILYHGPRNALPKEYDPKTVTDLLNSYRSVIYCTRGNCDSEVDQMVLNFPMLAEYVLLPLERKCIFATHGHHYNMQSPPPLNDGDILLYGHTHIAEIKQFASNIYINPGSVALPKGKTQNSYLILEGQRFLLKEFDGMPIMEYSIPAD